MTSHSSDIFSGLALWLVPSDAAFVSTLQTEAAALRSANAGKCSGEFGVHATLLAGLGDRGITVEGLTGCLKEAIAIWKKQREEEGGSLTVGLKDVTSRGKYFQCILISLNPTQSLIDLNTITSKIVNSHYPPPPPSSTSEEYFPHISLLYSSIPQSSAQSQIQHMQQNEVFTPHKSGISFRGFSEVEFDRVEVWDCTGKPEDWTKKASVPL